MASLALKMYLAVPKLMRSVGSVSDEAEDTTEMFQVADMAKFPPLAD